MSKTHDSRLDESIILTDLGHSQPGKWDSRTKYICSVASDDFGDWSEDLGSTVCARCVGIKDEQPAVIRNGGQAHALRTGIVPCQTVDAAAVALQRGAMHQASDHRRVNVEVGRVLPDDTTSSASDLPTKEQSGEAPGSPLSLHPPCIVTECKVVMVCHDCSNGAVCLPA